MTSWRHFHSLCIFSVAHPLFITPGERPRPWRQHLVETVSIVSCAVHDLSAREESAGDYFSALREGIIEGTAARNRAAKEIRILSGLISVTFVFRTHGPSNFAPGSDSRGLPPQKSAETLKRIKAHCKSADKPQQVPRRLLRTGRKRSSRKRERRLAS